MKTYRYVVYGLELEWDRKLCEECKGQGLCLFDDTTKSVSCSKPCNMEHVRSFNVRAIELLHYFPSQTGIGKDSFFLLSMLIGTTNKIIKVLLWLKPWLPVLLVIEPRTWDLSPITLLGVTLFLPLHLSGVPDLSSMLSKLAEDELVALAGDHGLLESLALLVTMNILRSYAEVVSPLAHKDSEDENTYQYVAFGDLKASEVGDSCHVDPVIITIPLDKKNLSYIKNLVHDGPELSVTMLSAMSLSSILEVFLTENTMMPSPILLAHDDEDYEGYLFREAGFGGMIPHQLGNLSNLHYLNLREFLDLSLVNLKKAFDWLVVINNALPSLAQLHLSYCQLPPISPFVGVNLSNLIRRRINSILRYLTRLYFSHLELLNLGFNNLQGEVSSVIGNMTSLIGLDLSDNYDLQFNRGIPASFENLYNLKVLHITEVFEIRRDVFRISLSR
ncbi:unnamed protein product [Dovyalis caffra]|uniref:Uncharacterized protein n=1 Tax=Dovyalis caffra TaxID=77055 RepID=A0AAV1QR16_9ROSI|nr:unnamed protein product [Dovyalis caffra]